MHPMKNREFMAIGPQLFKVFTRQWVIPPPAYTNICYLSEKKNGIIRKKDVFIKKGDRPSAFIVNLHFYGNLYSYYFFLHSLHLCSFNKYLLSVFFSVPEGGLGPEHTDANKTKQQ